MAKSPITVAQFLDNAINMSGKTQIEIATEIGYDKPNIITMFKQGKTRLPINKIGTVAVALGVDPVHMLRLALSEYLPETWEVIEQVFNDKLVTEEELTVINIMRSEGGGLPVQPSSKEDIDEVKVMVRKWRKNFEAHADASRRRVAAQPKNKRTG
jgi:hypothetical protein